MIRNLWYAVLESREVKNKDLLGVTRLGEKLLFWRNDEGSVVCFFDRCVHRGAAIACGKHYGDRVACPFHGLEYDSSGRCVRIPANGKDAPVPPQFRMRTYPAYEAYGIIWIWWGENPPADLQPPSFFEDLKEKKHWMTVVDPWDTHYTRVLENQLDVVHLPFVHYNTIGRGNKTLVEGPGFEWVGDCMFYHYAYNKVDDGSRPRTPQEVPVPDPMRDYKLETILPNIWQNRIAESMRILGLFVPVDETHTLLYLRFYQDFVKVPGARWIVDKIFCWFNLIVAHQDRRVVVTQIPKTDGTGTGEKLIQGDLPIIEFRKKRLQFKKLVENAAALDDENSK